VVIAARRSRLHRRCYIGNRKKLHLTYVDENGKSAPCMLALQIPVLRRQADVRSDPHSLGEATCPGEGGHSKKFFWQDER